MTNDNLPDLDLLDTPEKLKQKIFVSYKLLYIELSFIFFFILLNLLGFSILVFPFFAVVVFIYAGIAPFIKPQFTKSPSLRIGLGIWNIIHLLLISFGIIYTMDAANTAYPLLTYGLISLAIYYVVLPFVESVRLDSFRFLTILFFGFGFACFIIGVLLNFNSWSYSRMFLLTGPLLVGISGIMMLFQLTRDQKQHTYYWFYLPRIIALLVSCFLGM